jgi:hypothetical protein
MCLSPDLPPGSCLHPSAGGDRAEVRMPPRRAPDSTSTAKRAAYMAKAAQDYAQHAIAARIVQGLPQHVEHEATLAVVARLLQPPSPRSTRSRVA